MWTYGKEPVKTKKPTKAPVKKHQLKKNPPSKSSYVSVVRNELQSSEKKRYPPNISSPYRSLHTAPASNTKTSERKHYRKTWRQQITRRNHKDTKVWTTTRRPTTAIIQNRWGDLDRTISTGMKTTFIGRGVRNYFLGGGKPNQGERFKPRAW